MGAAKDHGGGRRRPAVAAGDRSGPFVSGPAAIGPIGGALLIQILSVIPFQRLHRPVTRSRLVRFLVATGLVAAAVMVAVTFALHAAGWKESSLPAIVAGLGGTMLTIWHIQKWLFRSMIERHDTPPDDGTGNEEALGLFQPTQKPGWGE